MCSILVGFILEVERGVMVEGRVSKVDRSGWSFGFLFSL